MEIVKLEEKLSLITELWSPKIVGELNNQYVKLAKVEGEFVWHDHENEDEMFLVINGELSIDFRDKTIVLHAGEMCIVPKGVEHRPRAEKETHILLFEPKVTAHTGKVECDLTVTNQEHI